MRVLEVIVAAGLAAAAYFALLRWVALPVANRFADWSERRLTEKLREVARRQRQLEAFPPHQFRRSVRVGIGPCGQLRPLHAEFFRIVAHLRETDPDWCRANRWP